LEEEEEDDEEEEKEKQDFFRAKTASLGDNKSSKRRVMDGEKILRTRSRS
jgi:hypothetical protein